MNASMSDINYSETGGQYSALNSKLYLMDQFELNANDATASQSTTYESSRLSSAQNPSFNLAQDQYSLEQTNLAPGVVNSMVHAGDESGEGGNADQPLDNSNPTQNVVSAATSTAALLGVNAEAIKPMGGGEDAFDPSAPGHAGGGSAGVNGQAVERAAANAGGERSGGNSSHTTIDNQTTHVENHSTTVENHHNTTVEGDVHTDLHVVDTTVVNNVIDSTNTLINNTLNNTVNQVNTLIDSTTNLIDNTLVNVTQLGDTALNHVENVVNHLGDTLRDVTGDVFNVVNNTTHSLFETLTNTTQVIGSITTEILGDLLGKIEFNLDIDLGLNSDLLNQFDLSNLANTYSLLNDSLIRHAVFELTSDFLNINIDTGLIDNNPIVTSVHETVGDVLGQMDGITAHIPVISAVDSVLDAVVPELPFDQIDLGLNDHGVIDLNDLNITNDTNGVQDLGTSLLSDDNVLDNSLELFGDEGSLIDDVLNLNGEEVINTEEGLAEVVDNAGNVLQGGGDDLLDDVGTILGGEEGGGLLDEVTQELADGLGGALSSEEGGLLDSLDSVLGGDDSDSLVNPLIEDISETADNLPGVDGLDLDTASSEFTGGVLDGLAGGSDDGLVNDVPLINEAEGSAVSSENLVDDVGQEVNQIINLFETTLAANDEPVESSTATQPITADADGGSDAIYDAIASTLEAANDGPDAVINEVDMNVDATVGQVNDVVDHLGLDNHGGLFG
ncbi:hypothetical protein Lrub_0169 [Legionella rubrilucens]|uniref:Uncharacterized protein n=1 Tax=Legionella rubrilucens TaxID=458 RepID=A0A0W0Y0I5_9GAMM|nr:hypothetical protein [Legionella rubrilucens]KTD50545.1 hypothetical protein Lrub_0169 [Legionella rubrilucens]